MPYTELHALLSFAIRCILMHTQFQCIISLRESLSNCTPIQILFSIDAYKRELFQSIIEALTLPLLVKQLLP